MDEKRWRKSKRAFQTACLSVSLATAWAAPSFGQSLCNATGCPTVPEPTALTLSIAGMGAAAAFHKVKSKKN